MKWLIASLFILHAFFEQIQGKESISILLSTHGDDIAFDRNEVRVKHSDVIEISFENRATMDSEIIHNIALVTVESLPDIIKILQSHNYDINKIHAHKGLLAISKNLAPGEKDVVRFSPKSKGKYIYVCLMAGHGDLLGMIGDLIVE